MKKFLFLISFLIFIPLFSNFVLASYKTVGSFLYFDILGGELSISGGTITVESTSYAETCLDKAEISIRMLPPTIVIDGEFGINKVKINGVEVNVIKNEKGSVSSGHSKYARFEGSIPMDKLKSGSNKIEIEYFTQCSDISNLLGCVIVASTGATLLNTPVLTGYVKGLRGTPGPKFVQIPAGNLDMSTPGIIGGIEEIKVGDHFKASIDEKDPFFIITKTGFGWMMASLTQCFPSLTGKIKWGAEFMGEKKETTGTSVEFNAPNTITKESVANYVDLFYLGGDFPEYAWRYGAVLFGGLFPIKYYVSEQKFTNVKINFRPDGLLPDLQCTSLLQAFAEGYALPSIPEYERTICWDIGLSTSEEYVVFPERPNLKQPNYVHVWPLQLTPTVKVTKPDKVPCEPAKVYGEAVGKIEVTGELDADGVKVKPDNPDVTPYLIIKYYDLKSLNYKGGGGDFVPVGDGKFFDLFELSPYPSISGLLLTFEGPFWEKIYWDHIPVPWCEYVGGTPTMACRIEEINGKSIYIKPIKMSAEIPCYGCHFSLISTPSYAIKENKLECGVEHKIEVEECEDRDWKIYDFNNNIICSGKIKDNKADTSNCKNKYTFDTEYARYLKFSLYVGERYEDFYVMCGDPEKGIITEEFDFKYLCPPGVCKKIDGKYECNLDKCKRMVE